MFSYKKSPLRRHLPEYATEITLIVISLGLFVFFRLTESGLSITKWDLVTGIKPPITEAEWQIEFEKYKQFPEYK